MPRQDCFEIDYSLGRAALFSRGARCVATKKKKKSSTKQIVAKSNFLLQLPSEGLSTPSFFLPLMGGLCRNDPKCSLDTCFCNPHMLIASETDPLAPLAQESIPAWSSSDGFEARLTRGYSENKHYWSAFHKKTYFSQNVSFNVVSL